MSEYRIDIGSAEWEMCTTYFIGVEGKVLAKTFDRAAVYRHNGSEWYIRARVESSSGAKLGHSRSSRAARNRQTEVSTQSGAVHSGR